MASGWRVGCGCAVLKLTSSMLRASRYRANIDAQRLTASTRNCCCAPFSAGCAAKSAIAAWWRSQRSRRRTQDGRTASGATWSLSKTRIVNQIKAVLTRFGIRTFRPDAAQGRGTARRSAYSGRDTFAGKHPRGAAPLPRAGACLGVPEPQTTTSSGVAEWASQRWGSAIRTKPTYRWRQALLDCTDLFALAQRPQRKAGTRWYVSLRASSGSVLRRRTCWSTKSSRATGAIARPSLATPALPAPRMRAEDAGASGALRAPVTLAFGAA